MIKPRMLRTTIHIFLFMSDSSSRAVRFHFAASVFHADVLDGF
jgi:hypothetical protein